MKKTIRAKHLSSVFLLAGIFFANLLSAGTPSIEWTHGFGGDLTFVGGIDIDSFGNVFMGGTSYGTFYGPNAGINDAYVLKYNLAGNEVWHTQFGTAGSDRVSAIAVDGLGNAYIGGALGAPDAYIARFNSAGTQTFSTTASSTGIDILTDIYANGGNYYAAGWTTGNLFRSNLGNRDGFIKTNVFQSQLGTSVEDALYGVASDSSGNVISAGLTKGNFNGSSNGGSDAIILKHSSAGTLLWSKQFGTSGNELIQDVVTDASGNIIVYGSTTGNLYGTNTGGDDLFVSKYDTAGTFIWGKQFTTTAGIAIPSNLMINGNGDVYLSSIADEEEAFVHRINSSGDLEWTLNIGAVDTAVSVGLAYSAGATYVAYTGPWIENEDSSFLIKIIEVPEPGSISLYFFALAGMWGITRVRRSHSATN